MSQQTAKRRRAQAKMGYTHLCKARRPLYRRRSVETSDKRLRELIERERRIKQAPKKK